MVILRSIIAFITCKTYMHRVFVSRHADETSVMRSGVTIKSEVIASLYRRVMLQNKA